MKNILLAAGEITNPALGSLQKQSGESFLTKIIPAFVTLIFVIGSLIFFFVMVTGAIQWITSGGDKTALESARSKISNALIGFILLLVIFAIIEVIEKFFGIHILSLDIMSIKI